jgi:MFS family permease
MSTETKDGLDPNRWRSLFTIALSQLMVVLDSSIVNIAIPSAKKDLGITDVNQQWVVTAYTLAFGSLLLIGGRVGDYMGRKKALIIGLLGFASASAFGGVAATQAMLFGSRALQGVFGALLAPAALALISETFKDPKERAKAFGVMGAISGGGAAIGLILGGTLTEFFSWRWCLGVNVPIAIVASLLAAKFIKAASNGWGSAKTLTYFIAAAILLTAFFVIESKVKNPMLPLRVLEDRNRAGSYLGSLSIGAGLFSMFLFLGLFFQVVLQYSPLRSGFAFLPFTGGIILAAGISSNLLPKFGPRPLMIPGLLVSASGLLWLSRLTPTSDYLTHVVPSLVLMSVGMAFVFIPLMTTALHNVNHHDTGVASAMINTSQQIGGSLGTALLNTVAATAATNYITSHQEMGQTVKLFAMVHGFDSAFKVGAALLIVGAIILFTTINVGKDSVVESDAVVMH